MGYNLLIHRLYWGYNPLTNLLLTSWDIQVLPMYQAIFKGNHSTYITLSGPPCRILEFLSPNGWMTRGNRANLQHPPKGTLRNVWVVVSFILMFISTWKRWSFLTNTCQLGWSQQPVSFYPSRFSSNKKSLSSGNPSMLNHTWMLWVWSPQKSWGSQSSKMNLALFLLITSS